MQKKRGISLNIDGGGSVTVSTPEEGESCCGIKICSKCVGNFCQALDPPEFVFAIHACPLKKWYVLWYAKGYGEKDYMYGAFAKDRCQMCGGDNFFRMKALLTTKGKKKGDWVCADCHPPSPLLKTESKTSGSKACATSKLSETT